MMLVHKQQSHFAQPSTYSHRRNLSAATIHPVVHAVQPTRTPGLLSISKPPQLSQRNRTSPRAKQLNRLSQPDSSSSALPFPPENQPAQSLSPEKRGRQINKPKDAPRSSSHRRNHKARQPSPAVDPAISSQAEDHPTSTSHLKPKFLSKSKSNHINVTDPFLDNFTSSPRQSPPKLVTRPNGKLARRRQHTNSNLAHLELPPAKSIPKGTNNNKAKRASVPVQFPICDDSDDVLDTDDLSLPSTHTHSRVYNDGPKTAPLGSNTPSFPFFSTPSPIKRTRAVGRRHKRTPSEGVFPISSDDEVIGPRVPGSNSDELKALFGLLARAQERAGASGSDSEVERMREVAAAAIAGYFASSTFQNSPSPDELPPPAF